MKFSKWIRYKLIGLYSKIVREKATPEYIAKGWAIGMFYGCLIPFGLQLALSIPTAFIMKGSKIGAVLGTFLTNQITVFFIYPAQCFVGNKIIGGDLSYHAVEDALKDVLKNQDFSTLWNLGSELVAAFFIGGAILTAVMTPITYVFVKKLVIKYREQKAKLLQKLQAQKSAKP